MSDFFFEPDKVPSNALARAQRGAVLVRLLSKRGHILSLKTDQQVVEATVKLLAIWRKRLTKLRRAGWAAANGLQGQVMRNCEPAMVCMKPVTQGRHSYTCWQTMICPWCWSRYVMAPIYERLQETFKALGCSYESGRESYPYKISVGTRTLNIPEDGQVGVIAAFSLADGLYRETSRGASKALGTMTHMAFAPAKKGFTVRMSRISLVEKDEATTTKNVFTTPSPRNLGRTVAYACPYPVGMMYGDVEKARLLMEMRKKRRFFRSTGCFRAANMGDRGGHDGTADGPAERTVESGCPTDEHP